MALTLTLDYPTLEVREPGFSRTVTTEEFAEGGDPTDRSIWADPLMSTLMLKPLQLDPSWIDTPQQVNSIIRLADLMVSEADILNFAILERSMGSNAGPWIYHNPVMPAAAFVDAPAPVIEGLPMAHDIPDIDTSSGGSLTSVHSHSVYEPLTSLPAAHVTVTPTRIGGHEDRKTLAETAERLDANAAIFLRWFNPDDLSGNRTYYVFYIGQYAIQVRDVVAEVWEDTSPHGDRSAGTKVLTYPLWGGATEDEERRAKQINGSVPWNLRSHDRFLLWLPYRRNRVLLMSNLGRCAILTTRPDTQVKRNADNTDWVNVRADTLRVQVLSPVFGRFQIQRVKFADSSTINGPIVNVDYSPVSTPILDARYDADHGTALSATHSSPPSYALNPKRKDDCPDPGSPPDWLVTRHGVAITLTASSDKKWTPFFYVYQLLGQPVFATRSTTPLAIADAASGTRLIEMELSLGLKPGEGRGNAEILDFNNAGTYPAGDFYYRSEVPVKVVDGSDTVFQGVTDEIEVTPLKSAFTHPRRLSVPLVDNWRLLTHTTFKDVIDFGGIGHITVVKNIAKLSGIDPDTAETPPINTTALDRRWNQPLSGEPTVSGVTNTTTPPWRTKVGETAAMFLERIATHFSGWDLGFRADGKLFYLPKEYFTSVGTRFYANAADATSAGHTGAPLYRAPVTFTTIPPEANVIAVISGSEKDGARTFSPIFVDWASIKNPLAPNYLGQWRAEVVEVAGGFTCPELAWIARTIFQRTRRRQRAVQFEAAYLASIHIGHIVELNPYGNYRITGINAHFQKRNWHPATYSAVYQERGY